MIEDAVTWIVAADGRHARIFEERRRHGRLHALDTMRLESQDEPRAVHPKASVHDSSGPARHIAHEVSPADEAEHRFLGRLAGQLDRAAQDKRLQALVLIAPPRALGALREALSPATRRLVTHEEPHDRVREDAAQLRRSLRELRAPA